MNTKSETVAIYGLEDNLIGNLAGYLLDNFYPNLNRVACIFGGRRPALFLRRELSRRLKKSFLPPQIFSMDDFVEYIISFMSFRRISPLNSYYTIFDIAKKKVPGLVGENGDFAQFFPQAAEINSFIEQIDLESIPYTSLKNVEQSAKIGYEVPQSINALLENITILRRSYHKFLLKNKLYSRGFAYFLAAEKVKERDFPEFDKIIFSGLFYLSKSEQEIVKNIIGRKKGIAVFQGSPQEWPVIKNNAKVLGAKISNNSLKKINHCHFYKGNDFHEQAALANKILHKIKEKEKTVIVLPEDNNLIAFLSGLDSCPKEFNVSMGYPLKRTAVYSLLTMISRLQLSRKQNRYYSLDYLSLLKHPIVKTLKISFHPAITRVSVHKVEEAFQGRLNCALEGSLFIELEAIERQSSIFEQASFTLKSMNIKVSPEECLKVFKQLNSLLVKEWEGLSDFSKFSQVLGSFLEYIAAKGTLGKNGFNNKALEKIYALKDELADGFFCKEKFEPLQLWKVFAQQLGQEKIAFSGSPLRGMQILGFFETRNLCFDNVIILDVNENILPKLKVTEPLIPREIMLNLGINRLEKEEEIQRYHFFRLISGAKNVHLIYEDNSQKEKSRFLEELFWREQKEKNDPLAVSLGKASTSLEILPEKGNIAKTKEIVRFLETMVYSPSSIDTYLNCPLRFYFSYVLGLKQYTQLEEPDASYLGTFIHALLEKGFSPFVGRSFRIDTGFRKRFFSLFEEMFSQDIVPRLHEGAFLVKEVIRRRLEIFLDNCSMKGRKIIELEKKYTGEIILGGRKFNFSYKIDRLDELENESIIVIDYKTGATAKTPSELKDLRNIEMERGKIKAVINSFQLPIYYYFAASRFPQHKINAALYSLRTAKEKLFISEKDYLYRGEIISLCLKALEYILGEIINPEIPFLASKDEQRCKNCPFTLMCR